MGWLKVRDGKKSRSKTVFGSIDTDEVSVPCKQRPTKDRIQDVKKETCIVSGQSKDEIPELYKRTRDNGARRSRDSGARGSRDNGARRSQDNGARRSRDTGVRSREAEAPASSRDTGARSRDNNARRTGTTVQEAKTSVRGEPRHLCEKNRDVGDGVRGTETSVREEPRRQHKKNQDKRDDARQERRCKAKREKYISSVKEGDAGSVQRETESKGTQEVSVVPGSVEGTRCWIRIGRR